MLRSPRGMLPPAPFHAQQEQPHGRHTVITPVDATWERLPVTDPTRTPGRIGRALANQN